LQKQKVLITETIEPENATEKPEAEIIAAEITEAETETAVEAGVTVTEEEEDKRKIIVNSS